MAYSTEKWKIRGHGFKSNQDQIFFCLTCFHSLTRVISSFKASHFVHIYKYIRTSPLLVDTQAKNCYFYRNHSHSRLLYSESTGYPVSPSADREELWTLGTRLSTKWNWLTKTYSTRTFGSHNNCSILNGIVNSNGMLVGAPFDPFSWKLSHGLQICLEFDSKLNTEM